MIKIYTKIAVFALVPLLAGCQWHNVSWLGRETTFQAKATQEEKPESQIYQQELPVEPLSLADALARGLTFNADYRSKALRRQAEAAKLGRGPFSLFPKVYANGDYTFRTNKEASVAARVTPTQLPRSTEHYTAVDQSRGLAAIEATWNLLDLGLSALNRKIAANDAHAQGINHRFEAKRLSTDIIRAFWRLHAHQTHHKTKGDLAKAVDRTLQKARQDAKNPAKKVESLFFMRELTDIYRYLLSLERAIADAPAVMNNLLDLPQTTTLALNAHPLDRPFPNQPPMQWIEQALLHSPELNNVESALFKHNIETQREIVSLLPSLTAVLGIKFDTNSFLLNGDWLSMGVRGSWNLLRLLEIPKIKRNAASKKRYQKQVILSAAGLVARQSVIANVQYADAQTEMRYAKSALNVQRAIVSEIAKNVKKKKQPERFLVKERLLLALASIRHGLARAELETAKARMAQIHGFGPDLAHFDNAHATAQQFETLLETTRAFYGVPKS